MRQKLRAVLLVGGLIVSARSAAAEAEPVTSEIPLCQSAPDDCASTFHVLLGVGGGTGVGGRAAVSGVYWVFRHFGIGADAGGAAVTTLFPADVGSLAFAAPMLNARYSFHRARLVGALGAGVGYVHSEDSVYCADCSDVGIDGEPLAAGQRTSDGVAVYLGGRVGCLFRFRNFELGPVVQGEVAEAGEEKGFGLISLNLVLGLGWGSE
jgi:hypothetical protein